jgi:hypothetical protein
MGYEDIIVTRQGRIATIEIARPEVLLTQLRHGRSCGGDGCLFGEKGAGF